MIIVNYWQDKDYDPTTDGYELTLAGVVNDSLSLTNDLQLIELAVDNDNEFEPKDETVYELYLERCTIAADPIPERAFRITRVVELKQDSEGYWDRERKAL
jgi:hypothetical protein